jgi:predicted DNA-binding protein with PD1-like motif
MFKKALSMTALAIVASGMMAASSVQASTTASSVVNASNCSRLVNTTKPFILVLNSGEGLLESITQCAKDAKLIGASISALGQVHNPTLAYFTSNPKDKPTLTTFPGYYELASFTGDISVNGNSYYTHAHAVLADKQFHGIAGHVDAAKVGLTVEVTIVPLTGSVERTVDKATGFGPIVH